VRGYASTRPAILVATLLVGCSSDPEPNASASGSLGSDETSPDECPEIGEPEFVALIDHSAWEFVPAEEDPLVEHRPAIVDCGIAGWFVENAELEIDTNFCNYAALRQPALGPIERCTPLRIELYHFDLLAPEKAEAHAALLIDGQVVWEKFIEIPGKAAVYEQEFISPIAAPAGAEVMLHLHNHGQNTWTVLLIGAANSS